MTTAGTRRLRTEELKGLARELRVGDMLLLSGTIVTGRDRVHKFLVHERPGKDEIPFDLAGGTIYHCGPVIRKTDDSYKIIAAGPTTSMRVELYEADVIRTYGITGIIGKGGMGEKTLEALMECGSVYLHTISGAAAYLADRIKAVVDVWKAEEFGEPEAMWMLEIEDFPVIVTMDTHGNSLHREIEKLSRQALRELM
ncbi:MAG TPA: FumA C-terminus/TtdB family hydratase beta subunit [Dissulfurispiraceae bacterium]|nr:FumA C-terminus/TtdB family hydratase beta subunit [Dissulfurispiraceae bacterium]